MSDLIKAIAALLTAVVGLLTLLVSLGVLKSPVGQATVETTAPARVAFTEQLRPDAVLDAGHDLVSRNGRFRLSLTPDGNLVLLVDATKKTLWTSSTAGRGIVRAQMQGDGNFVLSSSDAPLWDTGTPGHDGASLYLQDDGNLVIYATDKSVLWASNTTG